MALFPITLNDPNYPNHLNSINTLQSDRACCLALIMDFEPGLHLGLALTSHSSLPFRNLRTATV